MSLERSLSPQVIPIQRKISMQIQQNYHPLQYKKKAISPQLPKKMMCINYPKKTPVQTLPYNMKPIKKKFGGVNKSQYVVTGSMKNIIKNGKPN